MRRMSPMPRFFLAAAMLLPAANSAFAAVEHRAKTDALLFRTLLLEPPPLAQLTEGKVVQLIQRGADNSLVKTPEGLRGWVRNSDLIEVTVAGSARHDIGEQRIKPDGFNHSEFVLETEDAKIELMSLDRSFADEVVEAMDREQLEMRHDEN